MTVADAKANGVKFGRKPKLTPQQKREAIKRRHKDGETLRSIGRSYNVSAARRRRDKAPSPLGGCRVISRRVCD